MTSPLRILLIDDHTLFRESLVRLLEAEPDFLVAGHCSNISESLEILDKTAIDVILLDYDLGEELGTKLLPALQAYKNVPKILMVTAGIPGNVMLDVLSTGIAGVIFKHSGPGQLIDAIHKVAKGEVWLESGALRSLISIAGENPRPASSVRSLTKRQREVLRGILDGFTNKEIAWQLQSSESSVKAVIQELFHKAGVRTRSQLVRITIEKHSADWLDSDT